MKNKKFENLKNYNFLFQSNFENKLNFSEGDDLQEFCISIKNLKIYIIPTIQDIILYQLFKKLPSFFFSSNILPKPKLISSKTIIHNMPEISLKSGQLLAILGTSGSGKTTLLNAIANRLENNIKLEGFIKYNDNLNKKKIGYVMRKDYLLPNLTVRETLQYAALLRLPKNISKKEKLQLVEDIISELRLSDCADTYIGGGLGEKKGISGGERRRVSIGIQILTNPNLLLLDEPTSGLDSFTAHRMMETLISLAKSNKTIICTIHQPRSNIFKMFDLVMLLSKGYIVYYGRAEHIISYFSSLNYECSLHVNPADYFLDLISIDNSNDLLYQNSKKRLKLLKKQN
jgi:ABC-type multidrug transport system ATPase subunit